MSDKNRPSRETPKPQPIPKPRPAPDRQSERSPKSIPARKDETVQDRRPPPKD